MRELFSRIIFICHLPLALKSLQSLIVLLLIKSDSSCTLSIDEGLHIFCWSYVIDLISSNRGSILGLSEIVFFDWGKIAHYFFLFAVFFLKTTFNFVSGCLQFQIWGNFASFQHLWKFVSHMHTVVLKIHRQYASLNFHLDCIVNYKNRSVVFLDSLGLYR